MPIPAPRLAAACGLLLAAPSLAQQLSDIRDSLRQSLHDMAFAQSLAGMILIADDFELAGAHYRVDDPYDTELAVFSLPFSTTFRPWGEDSTGLYLEGALGYAKLTQKTLDLYAGALPGVETTVDTAWRTYAALGGIGFDFALAEELSVTPILDLGLAYLESEADYTGPGAALTRSLFDGLAFNWESYAFSYGGAFRVDWQRQLTPEHELTVLTRYDLRWVDSFHEDDAAQQFDLRTQTATLRADLVGPTHLTIGGGPLRWRTTVAYRHFLEGDLVDSPYLLELGGALELTDALPLGSMASVSGACILGDHLVGWTLGLGVSF